MRVAVWDTYVRKTEGGIMHFDILVPESERDAEVIYRFGREYLAGKNQQGSLLSAKECRFCHVEEANAEMKAAIAARGYYIVEMEGCN